MPPVSPQIIAHRGYAARYPENTIVALRAALDAGAAAVEVDVLLSADGVPVLMHDRTLLRTAGRPEEVASLRWDELARIEVAERARLGARGAGATIPRLTELVDLLLQRPLARAFIELKRAALERFGIETVVTRVLAELAPVQARTIVISFSSEAVAAARHLGAARIGWVLGAYDATARAEAERLQPDFLFCNYLKLPDGASALWRGAWEWVLYEVVDVEVARALAGRGARYVETMAVRELAQALGVGST